MRSVGITLRIIVLSLWVTVITGCVTLRSNATRTVSRGFDQPETTSLGKSLAPAIAKHPGESGFELLEYGHEALVARVALADAAERSIDAQYYIYDADEAGSLLALRLISAADRGVHVRLLVDDNNLTDDEEFAALCGHPNIETRIFNPFHFRSRWSRPAMFVLNFPHAMRRMHNKIFLVDGAMAILGGRNIGNSYFEFHSNNDFRDFDILMAGPIAQRTSKTFDDYWNSRWSVPATAVVTHPVTTEDFNKLRATLEARVKKVDDFEGQYADQRRQYVSRIEKNKEALIWAHGELITEPSRKVTDPTPDTLKVSQRLEKEWANAKKEVLIESSYFIPAEKGVSTFYDLERRGVDVKILTCGLEATDVPLVFAGYKKYRRELLEIGADLYEYKVQSPFDPALRRSSRPRSSYAALHSKVILFDRQRAWIGSFNLDPRSIRINTEIAVLVDSKELSRQLAKYLFDDFGPTRSWHVELSHRTNGFFEEAPVMTWTGERDGKPVVLHEEPANFKSRLKVVLLSLLPGIEGLL